MVDSQNNGGVSISASDIILNCTICQATLSSIHADEGANNGLRMGDTPESGRIPKLWLTECAHLSCGKHFLGGGVPFHSEQQVPRAPCPFCRTKNHDHAEKTLFFVNGINKGEYDSRIPDDYFRIPPLKLAENGTGFEALRFQYLSLFRFGLETRKKAVQATKALEQWEDKKAEIVRSLSIVAPLRNELLRAGQTLASLDHDVSSIERVLNFVGTSLVQPVKVQPSPAPREEIGGSTGTNRLSDNCSDVGSCLAQASAADLYTLKLGLRRRYDCPTFPIPDHHNSPLAKRKRIRPLDDVEKQMDHVSEGRLRQKTCSRDLMPPPPLSNRSPYTCMVQVPEPNPKETLLQNEFSKSEGLHSKKIPLATDRQYYTRKFIHGFSASKGVIPPTPTTPPNRSHRQAHYSHASGPQVPVAAGPPSDSAWPRQISQAYDTFYGGGQSSSSPASLSRNTRQRRPQSFEQGSLPFPLDECFGINPPGSTTHRYGSSSNLGLSSNARSSSHQLSRSPANASFHRQRLGEGPYASPRLPRRTDSHALDATTSIVFMTPGPLHNRHSVLTQRDNRLEPSRGRAIKATSISEVDTLGSFLAPGRSTHENDSNTAVSEDHTRLDGRSASITSLRISDSYRSDTSHERMLTADPKAAVARRRANR